ncbi:hypothetical protein HDU92_004024 [Lobulomyces angularis]|nr:hypothetical protein HDU92_004024 [Lobulomyces angularis]
MIPIIINNPLIKHNAEESTVRFGNKNLHTTREIKNLAKAKLSNKERKRLTNDTFGKLEFDFNDLDEIDLISPGFYLEGFKFSKVKIDSTFFKQNYTEMKNQQNNGITSKRNLNGYLSLNRSDKNLIKNLKKKKTSLANLKNFIFDFQNLVLNYISNMEKKVLELSNRRELKSSTFNQKTANNTFGEEVIFVDAYEKEGDSASVNSDDFILIKKEDLEWVVENFKMEYFETCGPLNV